MSKTFSLSASDKMPSDQDKENKILFTACKGLVSKLGSNGCLIISLKVDGGFSLGASGIEEGNTPDILRAVANFIDTAQHPVGAVH